VKLEIGLAKIKELANKKEVQNLRFRSFLNGCDIEPAEIDLIVHELYEKVSAEVYCTK